jgi:hypothetical protein
MTRYAAGDYVVSLRVQSVKDGNGFQLGFLRKSHEDQSQTSANESWIPLIDDVRGLQVQYFDPRLNVWVQKWTDTGTLPRLVKVTIDRADASMPWEAIIPLGRTPL